MRRAQRALAREHGFTIVEVLMAGVILVTVATGIAGVLTSSISANTVSRERTNAEQCANDVVEQIRRKPYDQVGIILGNPPGTVPASSSCGTGLPATATVEIDAVPDPTPTSYEVNVNYKKVTVVVTRDRDGKELARVVTFVAPSSKAAYGGINNAIINATVVDLGTGLAYQGATVLVSNGPSANRSDTTDVAGAVSFAGLTPNPTSGAQSYYDLTVTAGVGYETLASDLPPGTATPPANAAHIQLAPSQTSTTTIQIFKPASINLTLVDASNNPYTGGAALSISSSFTGATTTDTVAAGASGKTITMLGGNKVIPGATYTIVGRTTTGLCATPAASPVPASGYPGNTTGSFTLQFTPCPAGDIAVNVKQLGVNTAGAAITVTGGPNNMTVSGGPTDASGNATVSVPAGSGYTVTATKAGQSANTTAAVAVGSTTNVALSLPNPPTGALDVNVTQLALAASGATVTVTGGPWSISQTLTTGASGQVTFPAVPGGTGYTVTATKGSDTANVTTSVTAGSTTTANVALPDPPSGSIQATVTWLGTAVTGATVTVTGGPVRHHRQRHDPRLRHRHVHQRSVRHRLHGDGDEERAEHDANRRRGHDGRDHSGRSDDAHRHDHGDRHVGIQVLPATRNVSITGGPNGGTYTGTTNATTGIASGNHRARDDRRLPVHGDGDEEHGLLGRHLGHVGDERRKHAGVRGAAAHEEPRAHAPARKLGELHDDPEYRSHRQPHGGPERHGKRSARLPVHREHERELQGHAHGSRRDGVHLHGQGLHHLLPDLAQHREPEQEHDGECAGQHSGRNDLSQLARRARSRSRDDGPPPAAARGRRPHALRVARRPRDHGRHPGGARARALDEHHPEQPDPGAELAADRGARHDRHDGERAPAGIHG